MTNPVPSKMTAQALLKDAKDWLSDPTHWCRGQFFLTATGNADDTVVATCLVGSVGGARVPDVMPSKRMRAFRALNKAASDLYQMLPEEVNDKLGYEAAMKVLDLAISRS